MPFEPTYWLWSDGADKRRWFRLPPGTQIDTTGMDHWVFPIGTKLWKEFSLGGVLLETRLIERYGDGPEDYWMGAFVWNADQTDAVLAPDGQTGHQRDAARRARAEGLPGLPPRRRRTRPRVLRACSCRARADDRRVGPTLTDIVRRNLLSTPPPADGGSTPPSPCPAIR